MVASPAIEDSPSRDQFDMPHTALDHSAEHRATSPLGPAPAGSSEKELDSPNVASEADGEAVYPQGVKLYIIMAALVSALSEVRVG